MIISTRTYLPFPRSLVFTTYRDRLPELVPYMPNIQGITIKSRQERGEHIEQVNEWQGGGDVPAAARSILDESMLSWTEHALWDETNFTTAWKIETHAYTEAVLCKGNNRFLEKDQGTLITSEGELSIDSNKIKNVPSFIAKMVSGVVEDFLGKKIEPNLVQMGEGVHRYLKQHTP